MHCRKLINTAGFGILLILWIVVFLSNTVPRIILPSPIEVISNLGSIAISLDLLYTIIRLLTSFVISAIIGITIGAVLGYFQILKQMFEPVIDFFRSIPGIALFPLFILLFGVGETVRLMVTIFVATLIIIVNTSYGIQRSVHKRKKFAKLYSLNAWRLFSKVIIPDASPFILIGLRVSFSFCMILITVTEMMLGTTNGLGSVIVISQMQFDTAQMFAVLFMMGCIGVIGNFILTKYEMKYIHWRIEK
jgi:ABC-type nitrate/sulfonate/bicarbonate transport system permease component